MAKKTIINKIESSNTGTIDHPEEKLLNKVETAISNTIPTEELETTVNAVDDKEPIIDTEKENIKVASIFKIKPKKVNPDKPDGPYADTLEDIRIKQEKELEFKVPESKIFDIEPETGNITFRIPDEAEIKFLDDMQKNLNMGKLDVVKNKVLFNSESLFKGKNAVADFQDLVYTVFKKQIDEAKQGKQTLDGLLIQANKLDRHDVYTRILYRKKGEVLDNVTLLRSIIETNVINLETKRLGIAYQKNRTPENLMTWLQSFRLYGALFAQTAGSVSEMGRGLVLTRHFDVPNMAGVTDFDAIMQMMGGKLDLDKGDRMINAFLSMEPYQQSKFARQGFFGKLGDIWAEIWVNSLLAAPFTHVINNTANLGFNILKLTEFGVAATLNKIPGFGSRDGVMFSEVLSMITSTRYGVKLGLANAAESFRTGTASSTKLDLRRTNALSKELAGKYKNSALGTTLELMGTWFRLPGRFLVTEDEFAKGILYHVEIERISRKKYNNAIADGLSKETAEKIRINSIANPDVATVKSAQDAMLEGTFQKELPPGFFKEMQRHINHPAAKLFVPFYKTIMNIFFESNKRNPVMMVLGAASPTDLGKKIRMDFTGKNGKHVQQLAMAKIITGSTIMYEFANYAYGASTTGDQKVMITGMAPLKRTERDAFYRKGFMPYSIAFLNKKTGLYKSYSYARFDPISSFLAMSADFAYIRTRPDYGDANAIVKHTKLFTHAALAIYPYLTEQPFLTGIKELSRLFSPTASDSEAAFERAFAVLVGKVTKGALHTFESATGVPHTFGNYLQKMSDPTIYNTSLMTEGQGIFAREFFGAEVPQFVREFYKEWNVMTMANPWFNENIEPRLNLWAEVMQGPERGVISPIKITNEKFNRVDDYLFEHGFGLPMPRSYLGGLIMTGLEYNAYIQFINIDLNKNGESDMLEEMNAIIDTKVFLDLELGDQLGELTSILNFHKQQGKELFYIEYPAFKARVDNIKDIIQSTGKR